MTFPKLHRSSSKPEDSKEDSPRKVKQGLSPGKLAKKMVRRVSGSFSHMHVPHHTHQRSISNAALPAVDVIRAFVPLSPRSAYTDDVARTRKFSESSCSNHSHHSICSSSTDFSSCSGTIEKCEDHALIAPPASEPMFSSPPPIYIVSEVPVPFSVDEEGDASDQESDAQTSESSPPPAIDISPPLATPSTSPSNPSSTLSSTPVSSNVSEGTFPAPPSDPENDEKVIKPMLSSGLYLTGLVMPMMFLLIRNMRSNFSNPLSWWLSGNLMYNS